MSHKMVQDDEALSEVNVIPLADLSLVLLIILMVLSPMVTQALFQVATPNAQKAQSQQDLATPETPVIVTFEPTSLKLNGIVMGSELEFVKRLEDVMNRRRDKSVMITASPELTHGRVVHIMDLVKRHGAASLVMLKWDLPAGRQDAGDTLMMATTLGRVGYDVKMPSMWTMFNMAFWMHLGLFVWNPMLLPGGHLNQSPALMQVEFQEKAPEAPKPPEIVKKPEPPKPVVKKARKSGITLAHHQTPVRIRPVKHVAKAAPPPAPRTRISQVKMPKFIPHASDEDALAAINRPAKLAGATTLRPASSPFVSTPKLAGKTRGIRASDVHFKLTDRGGISGGGAVVNIPVGEERGELATIASAPQLHDAPRGLRHTSNSSYQAPRGEGVGELSGKDRAGYVGAIQVRGVEPSEEEVIAAGSGHGSAAGRGVEIGGPVGDRKILRRHLPEYPAWAEEKGISAVVKIFFTVRSDGTIRHSLRIVHSSGYTELDSLAKEALLEWKFSPTQARSTTDEAWGVVTFRFTLA